ncbi:MAG: SGNH/GDSL hydrolase family protein [Clostridia bacterium]|nr:SGNH/GDSL hydrolase family protein [Clostridia bacterium]
MELKGLKINFLGDSITEGVGTSDWATKAYHAQLATNTGAICRNYGVGGTRIARQKAVSDPPRHDLDFILREKEMDRDADVVVVFGGTNDFGHGDASFGTFDDRDIYTFYGAMHTLINNLIQDFPRATLVFMTPLHRLVEDAHDDKPNLETYANAIKEVCKFYAIPVLDLYSTVTIQPKVDIQRGLYMPDGLHPNDDGAKIIASRLEGFLKSL